MNKFSITQVVGCLVSHKQQQERSEDIISLALLVIFLPPDIPVCERRNVLRDP